VLPASAATAAAAAAPTATTLYALISATVSTEETPASSGASASYTLWSKLVAIAAPRHWLGVGYGDDVGGKRGRDLRVG
jgi:hypothetical protein